MDPFVAEIRLFTGNFAPKGWAFCHGQILPIAQNTALFSLLGTTYGGDGKSTFALPDLRGLTAVHPDQGASAGSALDLGQAVPGSADFVTGTTARGIERTVTSIDTPAIAAPQGYRGGTAQALNYIIALQGVFPQRA